MICNLYAPSLTTTPGRFLEDVGALRTSYEHSISATFGFEACTIRRVTTLEAALLYTDQLLAPLVVYGPDGDIAWEGFLNSVEISVGGKSRAVSLDGLQNRIRVRYQTVLGTPGVSSTVSDAISIARYGTRDGVVSVGTSTAAATTTLASVALAERDAPRAEPGSTASISTGGTGGPVDLTLGFVGWYGTLGWVVLERTDTSTEATSTQVGALIGSVSPGIGAINAFLSTSTANIAATGVSDTRKIEADTTYRAAIEQRLQKGNSSNQRLAWGVYEGRVFNVAQWAGATPSTITYRSRLSSAEITDLRGALIAPWRVRPNAMLEEPDFADPTPAIGADTASRFFVERVRYREDSSGRSITFEPTTYSGLDARIARIG
jgi:hypothetical protein